MTVTHVGDIKLDAGGGGGILECRFYLKCLPRAMGNTLLSVSSVCPRRGGGRRGVFAGGSYLNLSAETVVLVLMGAARQAQT